MMNSADARTLLHTAERRTQARLRRRRMLLPVVALVVMIVTSVQLLLGGVATAVRLALLTVGIAVCVWQVPWWQRRHSRIASHAEPVSGRRASVVSIVLAVAVATAVGVGFSLASLALLPERYQLAPFLLVLTAVFAWATARAARR